MNKEEYYEISKKEKVPKRCPILNYCKRRACTIFYFSYSEIYSSKDLIKILQSHGELPSDFEQKMIDVQGEQPSMLRSKGLKSYRYVCPEVNLFDNDNAFPPAYGTASTIGKWDVEFRSDSNFKSYECKHYTECPEFCKYSFDKNIKQSKTSTKNRVGISKKLRFEIFQRDKFTCQYCGRTKDDDKVKLELDHIKPVSRGGTDDYDNLTTSCYDCNQGKSNKII